MKKMVVFSFNTIKIIDMLVIYVIIKKDRRHFMEIPFLQPTISSIKKSIKGIDDSYNNFWDILAELIQNSVDAIHQKSDQTGIIEIEINAIEHMIRIYDNGIGISKEDIPTLLSPFSTNKENHAESIGEKGVGLKFVIFQSNDFKMKTSSFHSNETSQVSIEGAKVWKESDSLEEFYLHLETTETPFKGTEIIIKGIENDMLFDLNFNSLKFIIRTKTAIGNILSIFQEVPHIQVTFKHTARNGEKHTEKIPYRYWLPTENIKKNEHCDLKDFTNWLAEADRSDSEKRNYLKNKIIVQTGNIQHNEYRNIKYWSCFVPKRKVWNDISIMDGLLTEDVIKREEVMQDKIFSTHQSGIYTSVKGMPTGISIEHPNTGYAGYWANIFIIFEDSMLKFDIGRKSINGNTKVIYKKRAKEIFDTYLNYITKYVSGDLEVQTNPIWDRDNIKAEIDSMPKLNNPLIRFKNIPSDQEASIAAIFYELIGASHIAHLEPVISGYRNRYDLYAYWKNHFIVIEFKSHLRNIIRDFDDYIKYSNEIDYIVCWDVNDDDLIALHNASLTLEEIDDSSLFPLQEEYLPETTHKIIVSPTASPIYVIDLKRVINKIQNTVPA